MFSGNLNDHFEILFRFHSLSTLWQNPLFIMNNIAQKLHPETQRRKIQALWLFHSQPYQSPPGQQHTGKMPGLGQPVCGRPILTRTSTITLRAEVPLWLLKLLKMTITPVVVGVQMHGAASSVWYNPCGISLRILLLMWQVETQTLLKVTGF